MLYLKEFIKLLIDLYLNLNILLKIVGWAIVFYFISYIFSPQEYKYTSILVPTDNSSKIEEYTSQTGLLTDTNLKDYTFSNPEFYSKIIFSEKFLYELLADTIDDKRIFDYLCEDIKPSFKSQIKMFPNYLLSHFQEKKINVIVDELIPKNATLLLKYRINVEIDHVKSCIYIRTVMQDINVANKINDIIVDKLHNYLLFLHHNNTSAKYNSLLKELSNYKVIYFDILKDLGLLRDENHSLIKHSSEEMLKISRLESELKVYRKLIIDANMKIMDVYLMNNPKYFEVISNEIEEIKHTSKFVYPIILYVIMCVFFDLKINQNVFRRKKLFKMIIYSIIFYIMIW